MNSVKTITTAAAFVLALSGYAFAQFPRSSVIISSGGVVDTIPGAVNRVPSAVDRVPSAVEAAPSAVESSGSSNTTRSGGRTRVDRTLMR
jgi:hypothetical protein